MSNQITNICRKYKKDISDPDVLELREVLHDKNGYFPQFAKWLFTTSTTIGELREIMVLLNEIKISKAVTSFKTSESLYDHLTETQNKRKLNQVIKSIPSQSRSNMSKRIKDAIYTNIDKELILKDFFSKKGGRCKTEDDLYQNTMEIINDGDSNRSYKSLLDKINSVLHGGYFWYIFKSILNDLGLYKNYDKTDGGEVVYKDGSTIILKVNTFEISKKLGSRHWCISSSEYQWSSYTRGDRTQYFIFQTHLDTSDNHSMIGVTIGEYFGKIESAHIKNDTICQHSYLDKFKKYLTGANRVVDNMNVLVRESIYDVDLMYSTNNWMEVLDSCEYERHFTGRRLMNNRRHIGSLRSYRNGNSSNYIEKLSKSIYKELILKNHNRTLDFGPSHMYGSSISRGVSVKSNYDFNNPFFNYLCSNTKVTDSSFYHICALIDEDDIENEDMKEIVLLGKLIFLSNEIVFNRDFYYTQSPTSDPSKYGNFYGNDRRSIDEIDMKIRQIDHYLNIKNVESRIRNKWIGLDYDGKVSNIESMVQVTDPRDHRFGTPNSSRIQYNRDNNP